VAHTIADEYADHHRETVSVELQLAQLQNKINHLWVALGSQRLIGVAVGLLAHRYGTGTDEAWERLVALSQHTNTKVRDIARALVHAFDGTIRCEDAELLAAVSRRLPNGRWP